MTQIFQKINQGVWVLPTSFLYLSAHGFSLKMRECGHKCYACCQRKNKFSLDSFSERKNFHFSLKPCVRTYHKASDFSFPWYVRTYLFHLEWKKLCCLASVRNADTDITSDVISSVVSFVRRGEIIAFTVVIQPVVKAFLFEFLQAVALTPVDISVVNINRQVVLSGESWTARKLFEKSYWKFHRFMIY